LRIRSGEYDGPTAGLARGHVQTNLVILPEDYAFDFLKFCVRNPKPCPVLEVTDAGSPEPPVMAPGADLRTDVPRYRVYEEGRLVDEPTDTEAYWRDDLVSFLIGCSFTFERALIDAGLRLAHVDPGPERTDVRDRPRVPPIQALLRADGRQHAALPARGDRSGGGDIGPVPHDARAPVHVGDPDSLGVKNIDDPEFGEAVEIAENQLPVFWACGVTPQAVAMSARPPLMITHSPGHMFVIDRLDTEYAT